MVSENGAFGRGFAKYDGVRAGEVGDEEKTGVSDGEGLVVVPLRAIPFGLAGLLRASEAARSSRLVVPVAFVEPDLAEQTTATLFCSR
jgi:hypothetical protein